MPRVDTGIWSDPQRLDLAGEARGYEELFRQAEKLRYEKPARQVTPEEFFGTPVKPSKPGPKQLPTAEEALTAAEAKTKRKK